MTIDQTQYLPPARHEDHEHAWKRVDGAESLQAWAYRCEVCHRTWAGFVA